jgi:hypothetical protein
VSLLREVARLFYCRVLTKQTDISDSITTTGQEGWGSNSNRQMSGYPTLIAQAGRLLAWAKLILWC